MPSNLELRGETYYYRAKIAGKVHRVSTGFKAGTRRALELAQRKAREIENEIRADANGYIRKEVPTFSVWAAKFLTAYYPGRPHDYNTEATLMRRPALRWTDRRLTDLTRTDMELYFRERQSAGAKGGTLERERVLLKRCFRAAVDDGLLKTNPMTGLRTFKTTARTRVMTAEEEDRIRIEVDPPWQRWLTVAVTTGLRLSELNGVKPSDLREDGAWLWVRPELNKTRKGRLVPLRPETLKALQDQQAWRGSDDTMPYWGTTTSAVQMMMRRVCLKLKIAPRISPHDLRRTFATRCAAAGMFMKHLQIILGHSDITTTAKYYIHEEQKTLLDAITAVKL